MNVFPVRGEYRPATNESSDHGKRSFQDRQAERNHRNRYRNNRRGFLGAIESERAQHEAYKLTSTIAKKNGGGVEVIAKKAQNCAREGQCYQRDQRKVTKQSDHENHQGGEQGRSRREPVQSVDQVKGIRNRYHPQNRAWKSGKPGELMSTKQHRQVENSEAAGEEHGSSDALDKKFQVRTGGANIVIHPQKKDQESRGQNCEERVQRKIPTGVTQEFGR